MPKHCCYGLCNSDSRYAERPHMTGVFFVKFPKAKVDLRKCTQWVKACGRSNFSTSKVTKDTYICSKHFVGGNGPTFEFPDPLPAAINSESELKHFVRTRKIRAPPRDRSASTSSTSGPCMTTTANSDTKKSKRPLFEISTNVKPPAPVESNESFQNLHLLCEVLFGGEDKENRCAQQNILKKNDPILEDSVSIPQCKLPPQKVTQSTQTDITLENMTMFDDLELSDSDQKRRLIMQDVSKSSKKSKFYTGLSLEMLLLVFNWVKGKAANMVYWKGAGTSTSKTAKRVRPRRVLTLYEEFVMVMIRLRRGVDTEMLGDLFGVSQSHVSSVFRTWIGLLYHELKFLIRWPTRDQVARSLPRAFRFFRKTRAVIDCTEFFVQRPSLPSSQRVTWSSYKHHNTFKGLIAATPRGTFCFVSKLWSGSVSDRRIVEECGFLNHLEYGDDLMADRGFLIRDLCAHLGVTLNIPPFAMGCQMSHRATTKTRRIASARIHVERAIGRLKSFRLLQGIIPLKLRSSLDQIIVICAALVNLQDPLVK